MSDYQIIIVNPETIVKSVKVSDFELSSKRIDDGWEVNASCFYGVEYHAAEDFEMKVLFCDDE